MESLWPGVIVGEDTLARAVSRLRKALGDETKAPTYIETLPKRGYRLIADVKFTGSAEPSTPRPPVSDNAPASKTPSRVWITAAAAAVLIAAILVALWPTPPLPKSQQGRQALIDRANGFSQYTCNPARRAAAVIAA